MEEIREEGDISLWSARIGEWDLKRVWRLELPEGKTLYALCSIGGKGSKKPGKGKKKKRNELAEKYWYLSGDKRIECEIRKLNKNIKVWYPEGSQQAYYVKRYILLENEEEYNLANYMAVSKHGEEKHFDERWRAIQNVYGELDKQRNNWRTKAVKLIMELEYPFVVNVE